MYLKEVEKCLGNVSRLSWVVVPVDCHGAEEKVKIGGK